MKIMDDTADSGSDGRLLHSVLTVRDKYANYSIII